MASYYGYPEGVQIRTVEEGSAAEAAGLGKYDIIVSFDDQTISSMSGLQTLMQYYKAGETVTIEYYHIEGNQYILKSVDVTLGSKK
jgi:serine protease Do